MEALVHKKKKKSTVQWEYYKALKRDQWGLSGFVRSFMAIIAIKVKKEGELGAVLKSLNCWTQSSVTPFLFVSVTRRRGTVQKRSHTLVRAERISHDNKINCGDTSSEIKRVHAAAQSSVKSQVLHVKVLLRWKCVFKNECSIIYSIIRFLLCMTSYSLSFVSHSPHLISALSL